MKIRSAAIVITFFCATLIPAKIKTLVDFSIIRNYPESSYTDIYTDEVTKVINAGDFELKKWGIELSSSSRTTKNMELTEARAVQSKRFGEVLGVRIHFPTSRFNAWAKIRPPYPIESFSGDTGSANEPPGGGMGIIRNLKTIKTIEVMVRGRNFKHGLTLFLTDHLGKTRSVYMGNLYMEDWKNLRWDNPNYIKRIGNRVLQRVPLYPWDIPLLKLESIMISRHMDEPGGDFVTYFKTIIVTYDEAIDLKGAEDEDIKDEEVWEILKEINVNRKQVEAAKHKELNYLIEVEEATMHKGGKVEDIKPTPPVVKPKQPASEAAPGGN